MIAAVWALNILMNVFKLGLKRPLRNWPLLLAHAALMLQGFRGGFTSNAQRIISAFLWGLILMSIVNATPTLTPSCSRITGGLYIRAIMLN